MIPLKGTYLGSSGTWPTWLVASWSASGLVLQWVAMVPGCRSEAVARHCCRSNLEIEKKGKIWKYYQKGFDFALYMVYCLCKSKYNWHYSVTFMTVITKKYFTMNVKLFESHGMRNL